MKYMLLMNNTPTAGVPQLAEWAPQDIKASGEAMMAIHQELTARGELVGAEGLTGPEAAKIVTHDGVGAPVVTDGPFPESKEFLAGTFTASALAAILLRARSSLYERLSGAEAAEEDHDGTPDANVSDR